MMFHCTQCTRSFEADQSTPRCPQCGSFLVEPQSDGLPAQSSESARPARPSPPRSYSDIKSVPGMYAISRVGAPAMILKWLAGASVASQGLSFTRALLYTALGANDDPLQDIDLNDIPPEWAEIIEKVAPYMHGIMLTYGFFAVVLGILIFLGAKHMGSLESLGLAKMAAVLAIIPCTSPFCFLLGMPVGIWALIVLCDSRVAAEFSS